MPSSSDAIDSAIQEVTNARTLVSRHKANQLRNVEVIASLKATALTWFNTHRPVVVSENVAFDLDTIDGPYKTVLDSTSKYAARQTYLDSLRQAKKALVSLRAALLTAPTVTSKDPVDDIAPDFTSLAGNEEMRTILTRRWHECRKCVGADAHLAAIVMMGGLLEALFVARANKMSVKTLLTNATSAPKDKATGKTLNYQDSSPGFPAGQQA